MRENSYFQDLTVIFRILFPKTAIPESRLYVTEYSAQILVLH